MSKIVKSRERVINHAEVFTPQWLVNDMLDLVKSETERIDSRFLEPACGTGNFLAEILERKLRVVQKRYGRLQLDYERYAVLAVSSIYGIDILEDNVQECRQRLFDIVDRHYLALFRKTAKEMFREAVRFILKRNILWGDALTLRTPDDKKVPHIRSGQAYIVFSEWSLVNGSLIKRRDFTFRELLRGVEERDLFSASIQPLVSDLGESVFLPMPEKEYPLVHFLEIAHAYDD